ncbi:ead/Ea22-like family protein [Enterobacter kobei]|uniref:ead/Ea22-like family protein n=1 Tax=Enterobacter kobei TaxID=208224 RepID=UPI000BB7DD33|nr:ead/Ea22-like family protein [Enterobacter kobei]
MSNIDKQALRGQSVEGSYYLAECGYCGQVMPSSKLRVLHSPDGEADCYCPHCNAGDCEIFDLGVVGSEVVNAWNYQQKRIEALLDELEAKDKLNAELMEKQRLIDICQGQGLEHRIAAEKRAEAVEKYAKDRDAENKDLMLTVGRLRVEKEAAEKRIAELEARAFNPALLDVISERQRQRAVEGWTSEHDDAYQNSELADAAACYAIHAHNQGFSTPAHWPWSPDWWKQSGTRRDLVKAGALILAEIERIDRADGTAKGE